MADDARRQLAEFIDAFGQERGVRYFLAGVTLAEAKRQDAAVTRQKKAFVDQWRRDRQLVNRLRALQHYGNE